MNIQDTALMFWNQLQDATFFKDCAIHGHAIGAIITFTATQKKGLCERSGKNEDAEAMFCQKS